MAEPGDLTARRIQLKLGPSGISLDETGKIRFQDAEVLQALIEASPEGAQTLNDTNWSQCACHNDHHCGAHPEEPVVVTE